MTIKVSVTTKEKALSNIADFIHLFRPNVYKISLEHGPYKWEVLKTYIEIKEVHKSLTKLVKSEIGRSCSDFSEKEIKQDWPKFPTDGDHLVTFRKMNKRCNALKDYLTALLTYPPFRDHPKVIEFLQVSPLSFIHEIGQSILEGLVRKRTGDNIYYGHLIKLQICCDNAKVLYRTRWIIAKESYIIYLNQKKNNLVRFVMLVDRSFSCKMKHKPGALHALVIKNLQRTLVLKFKNEQIQKEWYQKILYMIENTARSFIDSNMLKYDSFAPYRSNQMCKWYVNASQYMEHVMNALNSAREEIYITDWWMCPELYLKRPTDDLQYRLDKILLKKANEGVKVYILLFKEVELVLNLLSLRTKRLLTQCCLNSNIHVIRHSRNSTPIHEALLWSHHEKSVIIDQSLGFMGGIDLCYGRWDDDFHRLVDLGAKVNITSTSYLYPNLNEIVRILISFMIYIYKHIKDFFYFKDGPIHEFSKKINKTPEDIIIDALMGNIDKNANFNLIESDLRKREKARKKWDKLRNVILFDAF